MWPDKIVVGIPAHRERMWLPKTLNDLCNQDLDGFDVWVCVNQPNTWYGDKAHADATDENLETLAWLKRESPHFPFSLHVVDAVHPDHGPSPKLAGVGWARRRIFDEVCRDGNPLCFSLDADTHVTPNYLSAVSQSFLRYPNGLGMAIPCYHEVPENPQQALHLLRYEIYMRYYQLSLWRIGSPYAYLSLGSAIAFTGKAYRKVGGWPPRDAGEDFYFLQRLRKSGPLIRWCDTRVYPASRLSDRVPFGTGPLLGEADLSLQDERFPFYSQSAFQLLKDSFELFPKLGREAVALPISSWLGRAQQDDSVYEKMRKTLPGEGHFIKACHERIDGLRTLQYLRNHHGATGPTDPQDEINNLLKYFGVKDIALSFHTDNLSQLGRIRDLLCELEAQQQRAFMDAWCLKSKW